MQLSKPFPFDYNSSTDNLLRQPTPLDSNSYPKQEERLTNTYLSCQQDDGKLDQINYCQFYQEYKKIYTVSYHLYIEKERLAYQQQELKRKIISLHQQLNNRSEKEIKKIQNNSQENRAKRSRRTAQMIEKRFKCNVQFCQRLYGSEGSLQQHIKLKHPQLYCNADKLSHAYEEYSSC